MAGTLRIGDRRLQSDAQRVFVHLECNLVYGERHVGL